MAALSLLEILVFSSIVSKGLAMEVRIWDKGSLETAQWLCENHAFAAKGHFSKEVLNKFEVYYCKLFFDHSESAVDNNELCEYMYPAALKETKQEDGMISCKYELMYLCKPGQFIHEHLCIEYHDDRMNFEDAAAECAKTDGWLPTAGHQGPQFFSHLLTSLNPRRLGFNGQRYWLDGANQKKFLIKLGRGLDHQPLGAKSPANGSELGNYFCLHEKMKSNRAYDLECKVYKEQFKMPAYFLGGTCYMLSVSVFSVKDIRQLHKHCQWFSDKDRVITPLSGTRLEAIQNVLAGTPYVNDYVRTTGANGGWSKDDTQENWWVHNIHGPPTQIVRGVWGPQRPQQRVDGNYIFNSHAVVIPQSLRVDNGNGILFDVPPYFRGHAVCASGTSIDDTTFKKCDPGWTKLMRDDGRLVCLKAFTTELKNKNYKDAMNFCKSLGSILAPMESADEQEVVLDLMDKAKPEKGGALWLGATRRRGGKFYWVIDGKEVLLANWNEGEPNNITGYEDCLQIYTGTKEPWIAGLIWWRKQYKRGKWNDIECGMQGGTGKEGDGILGGVCAKYLQLFETSSNATSSVKHAK